jgi:GNAT superfamily N-acetyltransferase
MQSAGSLSARVSERWRAIDPLLPAPGFPASSCGAKLVVTAPDGSAAAAGGCEHWTGVPGSLDPSWGAARRFQLTAQVADACALDRLLDRWREHLEDVPGTADEDTAATVTWPSRDVDGIATMLRHGFAPLEVIAARAFPAGRGAGPGPVVPADPDVSALIRRAGPADIDTVVRLGLEVIRFDSRFGWVRERPDTVAGLRAEASASLLVGPDSWTWLAERDGEAVGLLAAQRPVSAAWIAPMVRLEPAAYLMLMFVTPGERGGGIGAALTGQFHHAAAAAGVAVSLLHYEQLNPLSAPFWNRQGYRPLWTTWVATPASAIR